MSTSAGRAPIPLVAAHPNLLVVQTMSKSRALAGLRVGYAMGDAGLIEALTRVKDSFNSYPLGRPGPGRRHRLARGRGLFPAEPRRR